VFEEKPTYQELERRVFNFQDGTRRLNNIITDLERELQEAHGALAPLVTTCREWVGTDRCNEPAEFLLWGKLIDAEGLGPRCYDHAAVHVGHRALDPNSGYALIDLRPARRILG
jgi:hypothetical protein